MAMTNVGAQIRSARKTANLSQSELGEAIGRTSKTVRRYEQNKTTPDTRILSLIANATDHPIEFFVNVDVYPPPRGNRSSSSSQPSSPPRPSVFRRRDTGRSVTSLDVLRIQGSDLVQTGETRRVPMTYLRRVGLDPDRALVLDIPSGHYSLHRELRSADALLLDVLPSPVTLDAFVNDGRFVDGRYVVNVASSGLQIKDLMARPDGTIAVSSLDSKQQFRCSPDERSGIQIYAIVAYQL